MSNVDPFARFPDRVAAGKLAGGVWVKTPEHYCVFDEAAQSARILEGAPPADALDSQLRPAYRRATGVLSAPTGRIYLRFSPSVEAVSRKAAIADAGYKIDRVVSYAPNSVWLQASSGDAAEALSRIDELALLPDVENVEPQMLTAKTLR